MLPLDSITVILTEETRIFIEAPDVTDVMTPSLGATSSLSPIFDDMDIISIVIGPVATMIVIVEID